VRSSCLACARLQPDAAMVCPEQVKGEPHFTEESANWKTSYSNKETYRCRGKDQLIKHATRPRQPALRGVARHGLLVILSVIANREGSRPRGVGELEGLGLTARGGLQQGCA
jgi:hypothetical protein